MSTLQRRQGFTRVDKMCRKLIIFEDDCEVRHFVIDLKQFCFGNKIDVTQLFKALNQKGLSVHDYEFQFQYPKITIRPLEEIVYLDTLHFADNQIIINRKLIVNNQNQNIGMNQIIEVKQNPVYEQLTIDRTADQKEKTKSIQQDNESKMQEQILENPISSKVDTNDKLLDTKDKSQDPKKKRKEKQRKIKSAIECVKVWRGIYQQSHHKLSLVACAKIISVSKKSLDDYFLGIRLGEFYGFDFNRNLNKGIGVMRAFIKQKSKKQIQTNIPKTIKSFDLVREFEQLKKIFINKEEQKQQQSKTN